MTLRGSKSNESKISAVQCASTYIHHTVSHIGTTGWWPCVFSESKARPRGCNKSVTAPNMLYEVCAYWDLHKDGFLNGSLTEESHRTVPPKRTMPSKLVHRTVCHQGHEEEHGWLADMLINGLRDIDNNTFALSASSRALFNEQRTYFSYSLTHLMIFSSSLSISVNLRENSIDIFIMSTRSHAWL